MSLPFAVFDHVESEDPDEVPSYHASWGAACSDVTGRINRLCGNGYTVLGCNQQLESDLVVRLHWREDDIGEIGHIVHIVPTNLIHTWYKQYATNLSRELARKDLEDVGL